jgi:hypothetical protein
VVAPTRHSIEIAQNSSSRKRFNEFPPQNASRCEPVNVAVCQLKRFGLFARLGEETFFPTPGAAISSCLKTGKVDWAD